MSQDLFGKAEPIRKPPSLSFKTVNNYLESWNDKTIPSHIDRSVLPTSMSGGNQTYLQGALKFLGLVSENNVPEKLFHRLVETDKESKAAVWREIVTTAYDFLLQDLDIERATTRGVVDKFKEQGISGDSIRKAMIFFLNAAKVADIKVSPHINPYQNRSQTTRTRKTAVKNGENLDEETLGEEIGDSTKNNNNENSGKGNGSKMSPYQMLIEILDTSMEEVEQDAVWTLIRYLKKQEAKKSE